jgi:MFS family permease
MSHSARFADYREVLRTPGALRPVIGALLARLPIAMLGLSLLLYVQRETGSFAVAGLISAGTLVGVASGAIVQGRVMDAVGRPTVPLLVAAGLFTVAVTAGIVAIEAHAPVSVLIVLAFGIGATQPTVGSASRALWTRLTPSGSLRQAAYAYEAISMEVFFILGPALAGLLIAAPWPGTGVVAGAVTMTIGATCFALAPVVRQRVPREPVERALLGALASPGMRTVALAAMGFGVAIGFVEVAVPAAATKAGHGPLGGAMLAMWSLSSVIFGLLYATRPWPRAMSLRLPVLLGGFAVLIAPLAIPTSLVGLGVLLLLGGLLITPQATAHSAAIELVAPRGTVTEAFGWVITAVTLGLALGQSASGWLVEHVGIRSSFLVSSVAGLLFAGLLWIRRETVTPQRDARKIGLVNATMVSGVVAVGTGRRTSARTQWE